MISLAIIACYFHALFSTIFAGTGANYCNEDYYRGEELNRSSNGSTEIAARLSLKSCPILALGRVKVYDSAVSCKIRFRYFYDLG